MEPRKTFFATNRKSLALETKLPNEEYTLTRLDSTVDVEEVSDYESQLEKTIEHRQYQQEIGSLIEILLKLFSLQGGESLDLEFRDFPAQVKFASELSGVLRDQFKHGSVQKEKFPSVYTNKQTEQEVVVMKSAEAKIDVFSKLLSVNRAVFLNQKELKQLRSIIIGAKRDSALKDIQNQRKTVLEKAKNKQLQIQKNWKKLENIQEEHEVYLQKNSQLKTQVKSYKQQIYTLQDQIKSASEENRSLEKEIQESRLALIRVRNQIESLMSNDTGEVDLRLSCFRESFENNSSTPYFGK